MKTKNIRQDIFIFLLNFFWGIAQIIRKRQLRKARLRLARKHGKEFLDDWAYAKVADGMDLQY